MEEHLICMTTTELFRFTSGQIVYISAEGNYSHIHTSGGEDFLVGFQLGQLEQMIAGQMPDNARRFIRIGRNYIVNEHYICSISVPRQRLVLLDRTDKKYALTPSREALKALKQHLEDTYGKIQ
ncbi:MAG: LytTR family transcriptional regulator DNA-binding domain-containing protein [Alloprevotella sp.]|nr:LytTR family transcriptional regulator DNA-binding domain-containing protein [Alloprevotella sp.]